MIKLYQEAERRELRAPQEGAGGAVRKPTAVLRLTNHRAQRCKTCQNPLLSVKETSKNAPSLSLPD